MLSSDTIGVVWGALSIILLSLGLLIATFLILISTLSWRYRHIPGPKCKSLVFGHLLEVRRWCSDGKYVGDLYTQWFQEYGPLIKLRFVHKVILFTCHNDIAKTLLSNDTEYPKPRALYGRAFSVFGRRFLGVGLVTETDHQVWHKRRRVVDHAFRRSFLRDMMDQFHDSSDLLMETLEKKADGKTVVDLLQYFSRLTLDVISKTAYNYECDAFNEDSVFARALFTAMRGLLVTQRAGILQRPADYPTLQNDVKSSIDFLRQKAREVIDSRLRLLSDEGQGHTVPEDVITVSLRGLEEVTEADIETLIDDFITILVAGLDTTSNQLSFTVMEMCRRPEIVEKLRDEIDSVLTDKKQLEYDDLAKLTYMDQVLKETLRMYPPATTVVRQTTRDTNIAGYTIPRHTPVAINIFAIQRNESYHENASTFIPQRFDHQNNWMSHTFLPFSKGRRTCLGKLFSQIEAKVVLTQFLRTFNFHPHSSQSWQLTELATLRPKSGVPVTLTLIDSRDKGQLPDRQCG